MNSNIEGIQININNFNRYENLSDIEFLESFTSRENMYNSISQNAEEAVKSPSFMYSKKGIIESITKGLQGLISEKGEKSEKKVSAVSITNYSSNFSSTANTQFKKVAETPIIKAVRKAPPQNPPQNINLSSKKKISARKDISTPIITQNTQPAQTPSKTASNTKEKVEVKVSSIPPIKSDISAVDPKESLCHSFMSNMTSFLGERKSIYLVGGFNEEANNVIKLNLFSWQWE